MERDLISARQLYLMFTVAMLSPMVAVLPRWTAEIAGRGAWLTGMVAFIMMSGVFWIWKGLMRSGVGLAQVYQEVLGKKIGVGLTTIYIVWVVWLMSVQSRAYAQRMVSAGYEDGSMGLFLVVILGITLWMGRKKLAAFARMSEVLYLVLGMTLVLVLGFSLVDMKRENLLPIGIGDGAGIVAAAVIPCSLFSVGILGGFLWEQVEAAKGEGRRGFRWLLCVALVMTLLQMGVMAQLGVGLSSRIEEPFFQVTRGIGVAGGFQRIESLVMGIWLFSDFAMLCFLVFVCRCMVKGAYGERYEKVVPWILVGLSYLWGRGEMSVWTPQILVGSGWVLGIGVPTIAWVVLKLHKKGV